MLKKSYLFFLIYLTLFTQINSSIENVVIMYLTPPAIVSGLDGISKVIKIYKNKNEINKIMSMSEKELSSCLIHFFSNNKNTFKYVKNSKQIKNVCENLSLFRNKAINILKDENNNNFNSCKQLGFIYSLFFGTYRLVKFLDSQS